MKYLQIFVLIILIASCSSTKQVTDKPTKKTQETIKITNVPTIEETTPVGKISEIEAITEPIIEEKVIEKVVPEKVIEVVEVVKNIQPNKTADAVLNEKASLAFNHDNWNNLLQKHVSSQGNVNYKGFKTDRKALLNYIKILSDNTPNNTWTKEDKLAYWMNAYNAMTVDLILRNYPIKSIKDIKDPWDQRYWKLGDKWINLNEIEHDILREMGDPRIHFGIVCASFSCPKLQNKAFVPSQVDKQLTKATKEFLSDSNRNEISKDNYKISKIFQWFAKDFKQDGDLLDFLNKYSDVTISAKAKKSFKDYNWDLND